MLPQWPENPDLPVGESELGAWCDEAWATDRVPLVCDHAFDVLVEMKDIPRALALVKLMGGKYMHPRTPDRLVSLCLSQNLKAVECIRVIDTCMDAGLPATTKTYSYAIARFRKVLMITFAIRFLFFTFYFRL